MTVPSTYFPSTRIGFLFLLSLFLFLLPTTSYSLEARSLFQQEPVAMLSDGRVISRLQNLGDLFIWEPNTGMTKRLFSMRGTLYPGGSSYTFGTAELSPTGSGLVIHETLSTMGATNTEFNVINLDSTSYAKTKISETRYISTTPKVSPDGLSLSMFGKLDSSYYYGFNLWKFDLSEFLWDLETSTPQPSGYYIDTIFSSSNSYVNVLRTAWSPDSTKIATIEQSGSYYQLRTYNIVTKKAETVMSDSKLYYPKELLWPVDGTIYAVDYYNNLLKIDLSKKTSTNVKTSVLNISATSDGNWFGYSTSSSSGNLEARLMDVKTETEYKITDCQSVKFSTDGTNLVFSKQGISVSSDLEKNPPLAMVPLKELVNTASANKNTVTLADLGKSVITGGKHVVSTEPPTNPAEFQKHYTYSLSNTYANSAYFSTSIQLKNISSAYHSFKFPSSYPFYCAIYDRGTLIMDNSWVKTYTYGSGNSDMGPDKEISSSCYMSGSASTPSAGKEYTLVIEIVGQEKASHWETKVQF